MKGNRMKINFKRAFAAALAAMAILTFTSAPAGIAVAVGNSTSAGDTQNSGSDGNKTDNTGNTSTENKNDKTEKQPSNPERKPGEKPQLGEGETGILVDASSGNTLFEADANKRMYPASTTKIMTALLAVEAVDRGEVSMDSQVEITHEMLEGLDPDGSNMALKEGEILSLDALLKGLMIPSGNDAACAIAYFIGKSKEGFVDMMNRRAQELGAVSTHFKNPNGLHDDDHYTTAADMAKIACAAMKLDKFRNIVDNAHIKIPPTNKTEKERYYINTNGLLSTMRYTKYYYKGATGVKTGYTAKAGNCLVSAAKRNGIELIGVIFGGKDVSDSHKDSIEMLDWGFEEYTAVTALKAGDMPCEIKVKQGKGTDNLTLSVKSSVSVLVPKGTNVDQLEIRPNLPEAAYAPIDAESEIGTISVLLNGTELARGILIANKRIERSAFWPVMALADRLWSNKITKTLICIVIILIVCCVVAFVFTFVTALRRNIKIAKRRKRHRRIK
ncbi:MAG: D-alanyl-D-alanine carboxypeptidase [Clostridiales bacterium]|nr:D-alanyl-D-alanine carboxypeptidase [Clostridiales bacterium]